MCLADMISLYIHSPDSMLLGARLFAIKIYNLFQPQKQTADNHVMNWEFATGNSNV